jgi:hypothetical protein
MAAANRPIERFFKEVRRHLKNKVFESLELAQMRIEKIVKVISESVENAISITCFPYIINTSI